MFLGLRALRVIAYLGSLFICTSGCGPHSSEVARDTAESQMMPLKLGKVGVTNQNLRLYELHSGRGQLVPLPVERLPSALWVLFREGTPTDWLPVAGTDATQYIASSDITIEQSASFLPPYSAVSRACPAHHFGFGNQRLTPVTQATDGQVFSIFGRDEQFHFGWISDSQLGWIPKYCLYDEKPQLEGKTIAVIHFGIPPGNAGGVEVNLEQHTCELVKLGAHVKYIGGIGGGNSKDCLQGNAVSETIRTEYSTDFPGENAQSIKAALLAYRDGTSQSIPTEFQSQVEHTRTLLEGDLQGVDYVIVHNVHSIPFEGNYAFPAALQEAIRTWALQDDRRRAVFLAHDMPSMQRTDLIARLGVTVEQFQRGERGKWPFDVFSKRLTDAGDGGEWLQTKIGYGSISDPQRMATATLYGTDVAEISWVPTTGVDPYELQGADGLSGQAGVSARVQQILQRKGVYEADAILVYPSRLGVPRKRIELAVDATVAARAKGSTFRNIHLIVTGPWQAGHPDYERDVASLRRHICERHAEGYVTLLAYELAERFSCEQTSVPIPAIPDFQEVAALMRLAGGLRTDSQPGFAFMTTEQEGGGMPQVEAIVAGTEVLTSDLDIFRNTLAGIASVHYFSRDATGDEIGQAVIAQLEQHFGSPGSPMPQRSARSLEDIQKLMARYSWQYIVSQLVVPWLLGARWSVEP